MPTALEQFDALMNEVTGVRDQLEASKLADDLRQTLKLISGGGGGSGPSCVIEYVEPPPAPTEIIHILHHGSTLCGMHESPVDWPPDHTWVRRSDYRSCTCPTCMFAYASRPE